MLSVHLCFHNILKQLRDDRFFIHSLELLLKSQKSQQVCNTSSERVRHNECATQIQSKCDTPLGKLPNIDATSASEI